MASYWQNSSNKIREWNISRSQTDSHRAKYFWTYKTLAPARHKPTGYIELYSVCTLYCIYSTRRPMFNLFNTEVKGKPAGNSFSSIYSGESRMRIAKKSNSDTSTQNISASSLLGYLKAGVFQSASFQLSSNLNKIRAAHCPASGSNRMGRSISFTRCSSIVTISIWQALCFLND